MMSTISVLMSVYKAEKPAFLDRSLQSIWADQTLKPYEIILVEDGPLTPDLYDVIKKWEKIISQKLIILQNNVNEGLTKSLNKGIEIAKGDFIARMDSDDISKPQRFEKQLSFMKSHPDIVVLGGGMQEIDENNKWGAKRIYPESQDKILKYIAKANPIAHPTTFIRRIVFDQGYKYDERYRKNQDLRLWFELLKDNYKFHNLPDIVLYFRRTSDTYNKRSSKVSLNSELKIYTNGIKCLYGILSWRYIYPLSRYLIKRMPKRINSFVYKYLFKKDNK